MRRPPFFRMRKREIDPVQMERAQGFGATLNNVAPLPQGLLDLTDPRWVRPYEESAELPPFPPASLSPTVRVPSQALPRTTYRQASSPFDFASEPMSPTFDAAPWRQPVDGVQTDRSLPVGSEAPRRGLEPAAAPQTQDFAEQENAAWNAALARARARISASRGKEQIQRTPIEYLADLALGSRSNSRTSRR